MSTATDAAATPAAAPSAEAKPAEPTKQGETTAADAEARDRAAFDAAIKGKALEPAAAAPKGDGEAPGAEEKKPDQPAEGQEPEKEEGEKPAGDEETKAEGKEPPAKPEAPSTPAQREKIVLARRAFRRDGWTDAEIADLSTTKLLEVGARLSDRQAKLDKRMEELRAGAPEQPEAPSRGKGRTSRTENDEETGAGEPADDLDELLEDLGDGGKVAEVLKASEARANEARGAAMRANLRTATTELAADFPKLRDEAARAKVLAKMDSLDPSRTAALDPDKLAGLMREAAYIVFGPELQETARRTATENNRRALEGQPDAETDNAKPEKRLTDEESDRRAYEAAISTGDRAESQKKFRQLTGRAR